MAHNGETIRRDGRGADIALHSGLFTFWRHLTLLLLYIKIFRFEQNEEKDLHYFFLSLPLHQQISSLRHRKWS